MKERKFKTKKSAPRKVKQPARKKSIKPARRRKIKSQPLPPSYPRLHINRHSLTIAGILVLGIVSVTAWFIFLRHDQLRREALPEPTQPQLPTIYSEVEKDILKQAEEKIESERKKDLIIEDLKPGASYAVSMDQPSFPFGTAVNVDLMLGRTGKYCRRDDNSFETCPKDYRAGYNETLFRYFNAITPENSFKWEIVAEDGVPDWRTTDAAVRFLKKYPLVLKNFRGHSVFWNRRQRLPEFLRESSKEEVQRVLVARRLLMIKRYPEIEEWDLVNEPLPGDEKIENGKNKNELVFDPQEDLDFYAEFFKKAKKMNPDARLYVNEYSILSGKKTDQYIAFIKGLIERGAPVDGIGVQNHVSRGDLVSLEQAQENLAKLAALNLPIKITEFDVSDHVMGSEAARAEYSKNMLTLFYGTPQVEGVYLWGFQDRTHWRGKEGAGLFNEDFTLNEAGKAYFDAIDDWQTKIEIVADDEGLIRFRGYPGRYQITDQKTKKSHYLTL